MKNCFLRVALALAFFGAWLPTASAFEVVIRRNIEYVVHDNIKLRGDLYRPRELRSAPVLVAVHGGAWQEGTPAFYRHWGPYLASRGYAVFAVHYRLAQAGKPSYPAAVYDIRSAVQFVRAKASSLNVDPERIGLMGDDAGAQLATLVALAGAEPQFSKEYRNDPNAATPVDVKAAAVFYGIFDMQAQWTHDQIFRPRDQIAEKFLGVSPMQSRQKYFEASPIGYATADKNKPWINVIYGTSDEVVDAGTQSLSFLTALKQAQFIVQKIEIPNVGHYWVSDPFTDPGSPNEYIGPRLLRFLGDAFATDREKESPAESQ
ncbi:MAG: alpha/beta hydrolase [Rhizobiales bacterium]|nr:alpha/beta hydrolase [Hyphomicrobiales bacterium]